MRAMLAVLSALAVAAPLRAQATPHRLPHTYGGITLGTPRHTADSSAAWHCQGAGGVLMCNVNDSATVVVEHDTVTGVIVSGQLALRRTESPSGLWAASLRRRFALAFGRPDSVHIERDSSAGPGVPTERRLQASWFSPQDSVAVEVTLTVEQRADTLRPNREPGLVEVSARCSPRCPRVSQP